MDMASFGPTLLSPHTPDERCFIPSVEKFYNFLVEMLKHIPAKQ
jgi:dipeptidase D